MSIVTRRLEIFNLLQKNKTVEVTELAELFKVSAMTIRRDLALLEKQGLVITNYGGAHLNQLSAIEPSFTLKSKTLIDSKNEIAYEACRFVHDGDSIILDCGTTTLQMAQYLQDKRCTIITNSWPLIRYFQANPKIKLILAPGIYSSISNGVISAMTIDFFQHFQADKSFIGTQGFDLDYGASVPDLDDSLVKTAMRQAAKQSFLLMDHQKLNSKYLSIHGKTKDFDCIIVDSEIEETMIKKFKEADLPILIAKKKSK